MKKKSKIFAKNLCVVRENISSQISDSMWLFFNRHYSLLSSGSSQLYTLEALPFTYGQYVVIELADKLYNCLVFCLIESMSFTLVTNRLFGSAELFGQTSILRFGPNDRTFFVLHSMPIESSFFHVRFGKSNFDWLVLFCICLGRSV